MADTYKIGEAAALLHLKTYVLRFWESEFPDVVPLRTPKGQRLYTEENLAVLERIRYLLHEKGLTINGARKILAEDKKRGIRYVFGGGQPALNTAGAAARTPSLSAGPPPRGRRKNLAGTFAPSLSPLPSQAIPVDYTPAQELEYSEYARHTVAGIEQADSACMMMTGGLLPGEGLDGAACATGQIIEPPDARAGQTGLSGRPDPYGPPQEPAGDLKAVREQEAELRQALRDKNAECENLRLRLDASRTDLRGVLAELEAIATLLRR